MEFNNLEAFISSCVGLSKQGKDIYIVGAGVYGTKIADIFNKNNINWKCFVDKLKTGQCMKKAVISYKDCRNTPREGYYVISAVERYRRGILDDLKNISGISDETHILYLNYSTNFYAQNRKLLAEDVLKFVLKKFDFNTVLDIGCGEGIHSDVFLENGKCVTALDYGQSYYFQKRENNSKIKTVIADVNSFVCEEQFDLVWCSHVLEHQLNPHDFLCKIHSLVKEGGILAITVPHLSTQERIQGGHVSLWNAGVLLYHLVLAGFDCSEAHIKSYENNVSIVVEKKTVNVLDKINYDRGDIRIIRSFLPSDMVFIDAGDDDHFNGDIKCLNWPEE